MRALSRRWSSTCPCRKPRRFQLLSFESLLLESRLLRSGCRIRIVEKEVSFPQLWEKIVEVTQLVLPERLQARVGKQMVVVLVPPISRK